MILLQKDIFTIEAADLGTLYKLPLCHEPSQPRPQAFTVNVCWLKIKKIRKLKDHCTKKIIKYVYHEHILR